MKSSLQGEKLVETEFSALLQRSTRPNTRAAGWYRENWFPPFPFTAFLQDDYSRTFLPLAKFSV